MPHPPLPRHELPEYFEQNNIKPLAWIIRGIIREKQITALAGSFNRGKSPLTQDWTVHINNGLSWCGRQTSKRPVVVFDFETPEFLYKQSIKAISQRLNVPEPRIPADIIPFLARGEKDNPYTQLLRAACKQSTPGPRLALIRSALTTHPNAAVIFDPVELFFSMGEVRKTEVLNTYDSMRDILDDFPNSGFVDLHNLRKANRNSLNKPDLLTNPHEWLEEVCGSLDLMNRCDNRFGIDLHGSLPDVRVINGVVRGSACEPILARPFITGTDEDDNPLYGGWEWVAPDANTAHFALPSKMYEKWLSLPVIFRYSEVVPATVPKSTFSRLSKIAMSLGMLTLDTEGSYHKVILDGEGVEKRNQALKVQ